MLPKLRFVIATMTIALALMVLAAGVLSASRTGSVFAIGLRSAQGFPIERSLPEPPDLRQVIARTAMRRSEELDRLLDLPVTPSLGEPDPVKPDLMKPDLAIQAPARPNVPTDADVVAAIDRAIVIEEPVPLVLPPPSTSDMTASLSPPAVAMDEAAPEASPPAAADDHATGPVAAVTPQPSLVIPAATPMPKAKPTPMPKKRTAARAKARAKVAQNARPRTPLVRQLAQPPQPPTDPFSQLFR